MSVTNRPTLRLRARIVKTEWEEKLKEEDIFQCSNPQTGSHFPNWSPLGLLLYCHRSYYPDHHHHHHEEEGEARRRCMSFVLCPFD